MPCARLMTGLQPVADAAAQLRAEEQVQHRHHQHGGNGQHHQRTGDVHLAEKDVVVPDDRP